MNSRSTTVASAAAAAVAVMILMMAMPAVSAPIATSTFSSTGFTVSSTDLINGLSPASISGTSDPFTTGTDTSGVVLTNGSFGPANDGANGGPNTTIVGNGAQITYHLNLTNHPTGYLITSIETYSGWSNNGRVQQDYTVLYSTVSDPTTFIPITTVTTATSPANSPAGQQVSILDNSGYLAVNVARIRFDLANPVQNNAVGYRELDVQGIPEPGALALLAVPFVTGLRNCGRLARRALARASQQS